MSPYMLPLIGRLAWIDASLLGRITLVYVTVADVTRDAFIKLPEPGVIKVA